MVSCSGRFLWYHSKFCFRMLLLWVVVLLFKILVWFVIEIGPLKALFKSSTWRELVGIQFALQSFENHLTGQRVRLYTDNQNVVRMYGSRCTYRTSFKVFLFISQRRIQLDMSRLPWQQDAKADFFGNIIDSDDCSVNSEVCQWSVRASTFPRFDKDGWQSSKLSIKKLRLAMFWKHLNWC